MRDRTKNKGRKVDIYRKYRRILRMPDLTDEEIDEMRKHVSLLARVPAYAGTCERVWGKKFY